MSGEQTAWVMATAMSEQLWEQLILRWEEHSERLCQRVLYLFRAMEHRAARGQTLWISLMRTD